MTHISVAVKDGDGKLQALSFDFPMLFKA